MPEAVSNTSDSFLHPTASIRLSWPYKKLQRSPRFETGCAIIQEDPVLVLQQTTGSDTSTALPDVISYFVMFLFSVEDLIRKNKRSLRRRLAFLYD